MPSFELNERLKNDCFELGKIGMCHVLLMNNAAVPWFILVPETDKRELTQLAWDEQIEILKTINQIAGFVETLDKVEKLNIATIGNVVSQLHIHVIGRHTEDFCWPEPVWGKVSNLVYEEKTKDEIKLKLEKYISK